MTCPKCGANIPTGSTSCGSCGARFRTEVCPNCGRNILAGSTECMYCHKKIKRPQNAAPGIPQSGGKAPKKNKPKGAFRWTTIVIAILFFVLGYGIGFASNNNASPVKSKEPDKTTTQSSSKADDELIESSAAEDEKEKEKKTSSPDVPKEYINALKKAQSYSDNMAMSKQGIYDQLTSEYGENFPAEAAQYAIDHIDVDFKENALKKAKSYYEDMSMSKEAVRDQLISEYGEQFTEEEADYAIAHIDD